MKYYVYCHSEADTGRAFYIGKGQGRRAQKRKGRGEEWEKLVADHGLEIDYLFRTDDQELAFFVECEAIDVYRQRGERLINKSNGGEGCPGFKHSPEHIARLIGNKFSVGKPSPFKGKTHSVEARMKMSAVRKGRDCGNWKGKKRSLESRIKMSAARKGKPNYKRRVLSSEQVCEIRQNLGYRQIAEFARRFGVGESTIRRIRDGVRNV